MFFCWEQKPTPWPAFSQKCGLAAWVNHPRKVCVLFGLICCLVPACQRPSDHRDANASSLPTLRELSDEEELASVRLRHLSLQETLRQIAEEKQSTRQALAGEGVRSSKDERSEKARRLIDRLQIQVQSLERLRAQNELFESAILRLEAKIRQGASGNDGAANDGLSQIIKNYDQDPEDPVTPSVIRDREVDAMLDRELGESQSSDPDQSP